MENRKKKFLTIIQNQQTVLKRGIQTLVLLFLFFFNSVITVYSQNVGITTLIGAIDNSALLDIYSTNKGLLIPRVSLLSNTDVITIPSPANSLLVYNTNIAMTNGTTGYWYWDSTLNTWLSLLHGAGVWLIKGNAGSNPTYNFLGTADNQPFHFRVFNNNAARITSTGEVFFGYQAGNSNVSVYNTGIGFQALYTNVAGDSTTATGYQALYNNTTGGDNNTAFGYQALYTNTTGYNNTAFGYRALITNVTGYDNTAAGFKALEANTGYQNIAIGWEALYSNLGGYDNIAIGWNTLHTNTVGYRNIAIGYSSLRGVQGYGNIAVGRESQYGTGTGDYNVSAGYRALHLNSNGNNNTAIGHASLSINGIRINNTALGYLAFNTGSLYDNSMALGANAVAISAGNLVHIGDGTITSIKCQVGWTTYSDARIKNTIRENVPGLVFIKELRPVTYFYDIDKENELTGTTDTSVWEHKYDCEKMQFSGFIAQEVDAAALKAGYNFSGVDKSENIWGLRYSEFTVPLVKSVQELIVKNERLKTNASHLMAANQHLKLQIEILTTDYEKRLKMLQENRSSGSLK